MTIVGLCGSVKIDTDRGSGTVLMPPSLTLILRQTFAKYWGFARLHFKLFMHWVATPR